MITVRLSLFETNSSSTHAIAYCTEEEFQKFLNGEFLFDVYDEKLVEYDGGFDPNQFSHRDFLRIKSNANWDERASADLVALSDGTKFGVIKYDKEE